MNPWQTQAQGYRVAARPCLRTSRCQIGYKRRRALVGRWGALDKTPRIVRIRSISGVTNRHIEASPQAAPDIH